MFLTALTLATLSAPVHAGEISWHHGSFETAREEAQKSEQNLLVYVWSPQSQSCGEMYSDTMADGRVVAEMGKFLCFSANTGEDEGYALVTKYNVQTLPTVLVVRPDGELDDAIVGLIGADGFAGELQRVQRGEGTATALRSEAEASPENLEVRHKLIVKLNDIGDFAGRDSLVASVRKSDPHGKDVNAAKILLEDNQRAIWDAVKSEDGQYDSKAVDVALVSDFLQKTPHKEVRCDGWNWIAGVQRNAREDTAAARAALMQAWKNVPAEEDELKFGVGQKIAYAFWQDREELSKKERTLAVRVAKSTYETGIELAERYRSEAMEKGGEGCGSYDGCSEGEGCGGCGGSKAEVASFEAECFDLLARAYHAGGKTKDAVKQSRKSLELAPERKDFSELLAVLESDS